MTGALETIQATEVRRAGKSGKGELPEYGGRDMGMRHGETRSEVAVSASKGQYAPCGYAWSWKNVKLEGIYVLLRSHDAIHAEWRSGCLPTFKVRQGDPGDTVAEQGTLYAMRFAPLLQDVWQNG